MKTSYLIFVGLLTSFVFAGCAINESSDECKCTDCNQLITAETIVADDGGDFAYQVGAGNSLAIDSNGVPHISYYDESNGNLKYATLNTSDDNHPWRLEVADNGMVGDTDFDVGDFSSIALDSSGRPHIVYHDVTNGRLKYAVKNNGAWQVYIIDDSGAADLGQWCSLALYQPVATNKDKDLLAYISYIADSEQNLQVAIFQPFDPDMSPHIEQVDAGVDSRTAIAIRRGQPVVAYYDAANGQPKIAMFNEEAESWQLDALNYYVIGEQVEFGSTSPHTGTVRHDMVQDPGAVVIYAGNYVLKSDDYYFEGTRNIVLSNEMWSEIMQHPTTSTTLAVSYIRADIIGDIPTIANTGKWMSIAVDEEDNIHLAYQDETYEDLRYALYDGSVWTLEVAASGGNVGAYTSIGVAGAYGIEDARQPVIAYYDATNADLMVAFRRHTNKWDNYSVYTPNLGGTWSSLAVLPDGYRIGVSYQDPYNTWLMFSYLDYF